MTIWRYFADPLVPAAGRDFNHRGYCSRENRFMDTSDQDTPDLAEAYDLTSDSQLEKGSVLISRMGIGAGDRVLDVGCGTGRLALRVSGLVGPSGCVVGVDPSEPRIALAQSKLASCMHSNVRFVAGRAEDLSFLPGLAFDQVYFSSVFHWIGDKKAALREAFRVLAPGGQIGITTADAGDLRNVPAVMDRLFLQPPYAGRVDASLAARRPVSLKELEVMLAEAGFGSIEVALHELNRVRSSPEAALEQAEADSAGTLLAHVPVSLRARARQDILRELEVFRTPAGIVLSTSSLVAVAIKPR